MKNQIFNDLEPKEGSFKGEIFSHYWFRIKVKQIGWNLIFKNELHKNVLYFFN